MQKGADIMKKRIVSLLLMLSVSAGMLWGCGKQSAEMPADDETVSSGKSEDMTIKI